jgi:hypothetical protein
MQRSVHAVAAASLLLAVAGFSDDAAAADGTPVRSRAIGYVLNTKYWAVYTSKDKAECPDGLNDGPREQFRSLFPDDGVKRTILETELKREAEVWLPSAAPDPFPFKEAGGPTALGLNLDGKVGPRDFTSPDGEKGIDNQLFRAIGCISNYRGPDGFYYVFTNKDMATNHYNRVVIELTDVDSLVNDGDVTLTTYRGRDGLLSDAGGNYAPGATQRADHRFGKQFIQKFHGRIVDGVLTTDAADGYLPEADVHQNASAQFFRGLRFRLKLMPDGAEGLMGGYADVDTFYYTLNQTWSTHHQSYGQESSPSLYRALHRLADGYPDPKSGVPTAISAAMEVKFSQVFVDHGPQTRTPRDAKPSQPGAGIAAEAAQP